MSFSHGFLITSYSGPWRDSFDTSDGVVGTNYPHNVSTLHSFNGPGHAVSHYLAVFWSDLVHGKFNKFYNATSRVVRLARPLVMSVIMSGFVTSVAGKVRRCDAVCFLLI